MPKVRHGGRHWRKMAESPAELFIRRKNSEEGFNVKTQDHKEIRQRGVECVESLQVLSRFVAARTAGTARSIHEDEALVTRFGQFAAQVLSRLGSLLSFAHHGWIEQHALCRSRGFGGIHGCVCVA